MLAAVSVLLASIVLALPSSTTAPAPTLAERVTKLEHSVHALWLQNAKQAARLRELERASPP